MATFLASQDHPERGLCPHQPNDVVDRPRSFAQEVILAGNKSEKRRSLVAGTRSSQAASTPKLADNAHGSTQDTGREIKVHIANGHTSTLGPNSENSRPGSYEEPKRSDQSRKNKDPKSFTQNLFDTVAMKILHRVHPPNNNPPWVPSNERAQQVGTSNPESHSLKPKIEGDSSKKAEEDAEKEFARAPRSCDPPQYDSVPHTALIGSSTTSSGILSTSDSTQAFGDPKKELKDSEISDNNRKVQLAVNNDANRSALGATKLKPKISQIDSKFEEPDAIGTILQPKTSMPAASWSEPPSESPAQSLSHFTYANIVALRDMGAACGSDLHEQHRLLKSLGRIDLPQHSSTCGSYGDFLAYSGQSMTYILSNVDALLQSFLHCDDRNAASKVVWSYDFALIVDLFRKLRRIDMHPSKVFPSLWISAARLYPESAATMRRRPLTASDLDSFSLDPPRTSQGFFLNDLEACHIVKIILAALVASVPKCSAMGWLVVRKLHASGQVAPCIYPDDSPDGKKMIGKLVRTLHAFESETALSLVKRLARSINIRARAFAEISEKNRYQFPSTFSRVVDYVNADSLKICVADNEALPSIRRGKWIDASVEPVTRHPKEWPIVVEWLRAVILKEWDGRATIAKDSAVGGALGLMVHIRKCIFFIVRLVRHFDK